MHRKLWSVIWINVISWEDKRQKIQVLLGVTMMTPGIWFKCKLHRRQVTTVAVTKWLSNNRMLWIIAHITCNGPHPAGNTNMAHPVAICHFEHFTGANIVWSKLSDLTKQCASKEFMCCTRTQRFRMSYLKPMLWNWESKATLIASYKTCSNHQSHRIRC